MSGVEVHQFLIYADDVNIQSKNTHTTKKNTEAVLVATKETGLEVSAEKTKHMLMSREQNAAQNNNKKPINPLKMWHSSNIWERENTLKLYT